MKKIVLLYRWTFALLVITITGVLSQLLLIFSFGYLRDFCVRFLKKTSLSDSSKRIHDYIHGIAPFHKGIYPTLLVSNLEKVANDLKGGLIRMEYRVSISIMDWKLENRRMHIKEIRANFVSLFHELNSPPLN